MIEIQNSNLEQSLRLSKLIRKDNKLSSRLASLYWTLSFKATRMYERYIRQVPKNDTLYFGCGNHYYHNATNTDLFAPHRYLMNKKRPDIFWSGTRKLKYMQNHFHGVVCEHVIEHILPDDVMCLFSNFMSSMQPLGTLVISFPDIGKILDSSDCQGFSSPTVATNSVIYRFGHVFMYDSDIICEMLTINGFQDVSVTTYKTSPLNQFLDSEREVETTYITAKKPENLKT